MLHKRWKFTFVLFGLLMAGAVFFLLQDLPIWEQISPQKIKTQALIFGRWAGLIYVLAYALNTIFILPPIAAISLAAGLLFGKFWGVVYLLSGALLGTTLTFFISRHLARNWVERRFKTRMERLKGKMETRGFHTVLFLRLFPVVPYEVLNYAAGLTRIRFRDYFWGTALGSIPWVLVLVVYGNIFEGITEPRDLLAPEIIGGTLLFLLVMSVPVLYSRLRRSSHR